MHVASRLQAMKARILLTCLVWALLALPLPPAGAAAGPPTDFPNFDVIDYLATALLSTL